MPNNDLTLTIPNSRVLFGTLVLLAVLSAAGNLVTFRSEAATDKNGTLATSEPDKLPKGDARLDVEDLPAAERSETGRSALVPPTAAAAVKFDFDGDGKADVSRARVVTNSGVSTNEIRFRDSGDGTFENYSLGNGSGRIVPGDFNGGGQTDAAVFNAGTWTYKTSTTAEAQTISLGTTGDIPVAADYDGDGTTDAAVFRPSTGVWYIKESQSGNTVNTTFGQSGDIPTVGDYDGDGKSDFAVWRPSNGIWYLNRTTDGSYWTTWGISETDVAVPADYDGDDKTDIAVFRRTTGVWYVRTSMSGFANWTTQTWGNYGDQPVPADYDGDGTDDFAIWRPKTGWWWIVYSTDHSIHTSELGVQGNMAVPSAYLQQVNGSVPTNELAAERLKPRNETGGTNLYSQNFSWGRNLVSLPGRSGLDMSLGIGYNSLVWTKAGSEIYFDTDSSNVTPGFRLGFPTIEPIYFDTTKSKFAYMMVTTSGSRIAFRETAVSNIFETADSSYTILETTGASNPNDPVENITITVKTTDGTQMKYEWKDGAFKCTQIKDRNGNYITIAYDAYGLLTTVTDTLGRVVTVSYDGDQYPSTITQTWKGTNGSGSDTTKTWATFTYMNMDGASGRQSFDTSFNGLTTIGPPDGMELKVLQKITYLDQSSTKFDYNSYGQVYKVSNLAADLSTHVLNSTEINVAPTDFTDRYPTGPTDCPRFTSTSSIVENFNSGNAVTTTNTEPSSSSYSFLSGSITGSSSKVRVAVAGHPDELYSLIHFGPSGWKEGLTLATEDCTGTDSACTTRKRWTWTDFTQDNAGVSYITNPRVIESRVGDGTNTKKTTIGYRYDTGTSSYLYGLPETITVGDLSTVLKTQTTSYNLSSDYTSRRIIGLPSETKLWEGTSSGTLMSKVTFGYDESGYTGSGQSLSNATKHCTSTSSDCSVAYGTSFSYRGNPTSTTRWNVESGKESNSAYAITSSTKYNIAGSPISRTTPWDGTSTRTVSIGYTDAWNDDPSPNRTTYAYPTSITDPNSQSSSVKYRYDIGANVEATSPAPYNQTYGKTTQRLYDLYGRLEKESVLVNAAEKSYTRYVYPNNNGKQIQVYSTLVDVDNDTYIDDDEAMTETFFDGAGRPYRTRTPHPGSTGLWSAVLTEYDILGRVYKQSLPTEISVSGDTWSAAGDDSAGFKYTYQKYDWMNRVVRKINTDGNPAASENDSDVFISYEGCGCAGGLETTIQSEIVPRDDTTGTARRTQKIYGDILGRAWKTVAYDWDGTTPYTTTVQTFNGRDQVLTTTQTDHPTPPTAQKSEETVMTYDGHGRLKTRHNPIEDSGTYTEWSYNPDDSISQIVDPRLAITNFTYNSRGLATQIAYTPPSGTTIPDTPTVTIGYDNLGNRTNMDTAGVSEVTYAYDSLSRLTSETVDFDDLSSNYTLSYSYQLSGQLKSVTDPFSAVVTYNADKVGRATSVTGSGFGSVSTYASGIKFRAFGALKEMTYGSADGSVVSYGYDSRQRPETYQSTSSVLSGGYVRKAAYEHNADGAAKEVDNIVNASFDQSYKFDHLGRPTYSESGTVTGSEHGTVPTYGQTISYNAFSNMTGRSTSTWGYDSSFGAAYTNGRKTSGNEVFDASGNIVDKTTSSTVYDRWTFDASGSGTAQTSRRYHGGMGYANYDQTSSIEQLRDGDGQIAKRHETDIIAYVNYGTVTNEKTFYYVRSTVLGGQVITEVKPDGTKLSTKVYGVGGQLAEQRPSSNVLWRHTDPVTGSFSTVDQTGARYQANTAEFNAEFDPIGGVIPQTDPASDPQVAAMQYRTGGNSFESEYGCMFQYSPESCDRLVGVLRSFGFTMLGGVVWQPTTTFRYTRYRLYDNESVEGNSRANAGENSRVFGGRLGIQEGQPWYVTNYSLIRLPIYARGAQQTTRDFIIRNARRFLNDYSENCVKALKWAGLLDQVKEKLDDANFVSVNDNSQEPAKNYAADARAQNVTLDSFFRNFPSFRGKSPDDLDNVAISNRNAIMTLRGAETFVFWRGSASSEASRVRIGFLLHELAHHATGFDDAVLASKLLAMPVGAGEDPSKKLDEFFKSDCDPGLVKPPPLPARR